MTKTERKDLRKMVAEMRGKGMKLKDISLELESMGIINPGTQQAYTYGGIAYMLRRRRKRMKTPARTETPRRSKGVDRTGVIASILGMRSVPAEDRLALIELVHGL